jgi:hypothetical protein
VALLAQVAVLAPGGFQPALQVGDRAGLGRRRPGPRDFGHQLSPRVKKVGIDAQFLAHYRSRLAAMEPVQNRFAFKGFVEFPALLDRCLFHGSFLSLFTRFSVRQFEGPSCHCLLRIRSPQEVFEFANV